MKRIISSILLLMALSIPVSAVTVSTTTALDSPASAILLNKDESLTYTLSGTFTGIAFIEKSFDGTNWVAVGVSSTNNAGATLTGELRSDKRQTLYRWNASTITAGSFVYTMSDNDDFVSQILNNKNVPVLQIFDESLTLTGSLTASGNLTATGNVSASGFMGLQLVADPNTTLTPTAIGQMVFDTTLNVICISTAAAAGSWSISSSTSTVCSS